MEGAEQSPVLFKSIPTYCSEWNPRAGQGGAGGSEGWKEEKEGGSDPPGQVEMVAQQII